MNIHVQLCGMLVVVFLYIFYKSHRTLRLYTEKIFNRALVLAMLCLLLDIASIVLIHYREDVPILLVQTVCKAYIVSLVWEAWSALSYVLTDLYSSYEHKSVIRLMSIVTLIQSIIVFILPIYIYENGMNVFTYGPAVLCVYGYAVLYIISALIVICAFHKRLTRRRALAVGLWMFVWIAGAVIQFFNNEFLIIGFAGVIGVLILFVVMENPEANLDRRLGCFNSYALSQFLKQSYEQKDDFAILEISFGMLDLMKNRSVYTDKSMKNVLALLNKNKEVFAFKNISSGIVVIGKKEETLGQIGKDILNIFYKEDSIHKEAMAILVPDSESFTNMDELFHFLAFIRTRHGNDKKNVFIATEEIVAQYKQHYSVQQEIADALVEDRVEVFLQPIYSNKEMCFASAEALARIRRRNGELMAPNVFIPIAEENGQIQELGERVFEKVCEFLKESNAVKLGIKYIDVNLSIVQCEMKDLADRLIAIIEEYGVDPKLINLEITESAAIRARTVLLENMKKLIEYGFSFSLDDFGKGESNLMYMVDMPVSYVKLDYDMSKAFFNSSKAEYVVRAVVGMAHDMSLKMVAEGIETKDEIDGMSNIGIDYIQGYYYSRPLPMQEFMTFINQKRWERANYFYE